MEKTSKKSDVLFNFISKHKFVSALILCALFSFAYLAVNGFLIVSGNDDYCAFKAIYGGNTAIPCVGFFYTSLCVMLQPLFSEINVYMCLQEVICFISVTVINYIILSKLGVKKGLYFTFVFDAICVAILATQILFTLTATTASVAGLMLVAHVVFLKSVRALRFSKS